MRKGKAKAKAEVYRPRLLHALRSFAMTWIVDVIRLSGRLGIKNRQYADSLINNHISSLRGVKRRSSPLPQVQQIANCLYT